jgi:hypothetical protein
MSVPKSIKLEPDVWRALKLQAIDAGVTMRQMLDGLLRVALALEPRK